MSHIKHQISIQAFTRLKAIKLLEITEQAYGEVVMNCAYAYLHSQLGDSVIGAELEKSALFWAWWRNHWHDVDMDFVNEVKHMDVAERNSYYAIVHNHQTFEYTPQKSILQDALKTVKPLIKHTL
jgi:hypothetical protein